VNFSAESLSVTWKPGIVAAARAAVASTLAQIAQQYRMHRTICVLSALDDSILHDVGVDRSRIVWTASHAATVAARRIQR